MVKAVESHADLGGADLAGANLARANLRGANLADLTGNMVKPWAEDGWTCYCVDIQHSIRRDRVEGNIHYVFGDVRSWTPPTPPTPPR